MATSGAVRKPMQQSLVQNASSFMSTTSGSAANRSSGEGTKSDSRSSHCRATSSYSTESSVGASVLAYKGVPFGLDKLNHPLLDMLEDFVLKVGKPKQRTPSSELSSHRNDLPSPGEDDYEDDVSFQSNDDDDADIHCPAIVRDDDEKLTNNWIDGKRMHPLLRSPSSFSIGSKKKNAKQTSSLWGLANLQAIVQRVDFRDQPQANDKYAVKEDEMEDLDAYLSAIHVPQSTIATPSPLKAKWTMIPNKNRKKRPTVPQDTNPDTSFDSTSNSLHGLQNDSSIPEKQTDGPPLSPDLSQFGPPLLRTISTEEFEIVFDQANTPGSSGPLWGNHRLWEKWGGDGGLEDVAAISPKSLLSTTFSEDSEISDVMEELQQSSDQLLTKSANPDDANSNELHDRGSQLPLPVKLIGPPGNLKNRHTSLEFRRPPLAPRITAPCKQLTVRIEEPVLKYDRNIEVLFSSSPSSPNGDDEDEDNEEEDVLRLRPRHFFEKKSGSQTGSPTHEPGGSQTASPTLEPVDNIDNGSEGMPRVNSSSDCGVEEGPQPFIPADSIPFLLLKGSRDQDLWSKDEPRKISKKVLFQPMNSINTDDSNLRDPPTFLSLTSSDTDHEVMRKSRVKVLLRDGRRKRNKKLVPEFSLFDVNTQSSEQSQKDSSSGDTNVAQHQTEPVGKDMTKKVTIKSPSIQSRMICPVILRTPTRYKKVPSPESRLKVEPVPVVDAETPVMKSKSNDTPHVFNQKFKQTGTPHPSIAKPRINHFRALLRPVSRKSRPFGRPSRFKDGVFSSKSQSFGETTTNAERKKCPAIANVVDHQDPLSLKCETPIDARQISIVGPNSSCASSRTSSTSSRKLTMRCRIHHIDHDQTSEVEESIEISLTPLASSANAVLESLTTKEYSTDMLRTPEREGSNKDISLDKRQKLTLSKKLLKRVRFSNPCPGSSMHTRDMTVSSEDGEQKKDTAEQSPLAYMESFCDDTKSEVKTNSNPEVYPIKHCKSPIKRILKRIHSGRIPQERENRLAGKYTVSPMSTSDSSEGDDVSVSSIPLDTKQRVLMNMLAERDIKPGLTADSTAWDRLKEIQSSYKKVQECDGAAESKIAKIKEACRRAKQKRLQNTISAYYDQHKTTFEDLSWVNDDMEDKKKEVYSPSELSMSSSLTSAETMVTKRLARDIKLLAKIKERRSLGGSTEKANGHG